MPGDWALILQFAQGAHAHAFHALSTCHFTHTRVSFFKLQSASRHTKHELPLPRSLPPFSVIFLPVHICISVHRCRVCACVHLRGFQSDPGGNCTPILRCTCPRACAFFKAFLKRNNCSKREQVEGVGGLGLRTESFQTNANMQVTVEVRIKGLVLKSMELSICSRVSSRIKRSMDKRKHGQRKRRTAFPQHPQSWHTDCMCNKRRASGPKTCRSIWNRRRNSPVSVQDATRRIHVAEYIQRQKLWRTALGTHGDASPLDISFVPSWDCQNSEQGHRDRRSGRGGICRHRRHT